MSRRSRVRLTVLLTAMAWLLFLPSAHAYVDGGSLSVIFQVLVAGFAALGTALVVFWQRIKSVFRRDHGVDEPAEGEPAGSNERA